MSHFKCDQCNSDYASCINAFWFHRYSKKKYVPKPVTSAESADWTGMLLVYWPSNGPSHIGFKSLAIFIAKASSFARRVFHSLSYFSAKLAATRWLVWMISPKICLVEYSMLSCYSSSVLPCKLQFNSNSTLGYKTETPNTLTMKDYWRLSLLKTAYLTRHFIELSKLLLPELALL